MTGATTAALPGRRRDVYCQTCTAEGRRGYCAPAGCYCGHADCYAAASYRALSAITGKMLGGDASTAAHKDAWAARDDGASWIDQL